MFCVDSEILPFGTLEVCSKIVSSLANYAKSMRSKKVILFVWLIDIDKNWREGVWNQTGV